jgi:hypothetical protein
MRSWRERLVVAGLVYSTSQRKINLLTISIYMAEEKKILCDGCKFYQDPFFIETRVDGKKFCTRCR